MAVERGPAQAAYDRAAATDRSAASQPAGRRLSLRGRSAVLRLGHVSARPAEGRWRRSRSCPASPRSPPAPPRIGRPLAARNEMLKVLPAPLPDDVLERELATAPSGGPHQGRPPFRPHPRAARRPAHAVGAMVVEPPPAAPTAHHPARRARRRRAALFLDHPCLCRRRALGRSAAGDDALSRLACRGAAAGIAPALEPTATGHRPLHHRRRRDRRAHRHARPADACIHSAPARRAPARLLPRLFAEGTPDRRRLRRRHPHPPPGARSSRDKRSEPPVVAVSADGAAVVPLLGGHHGANALAREHRRSARRHRRHHHRLGHPLRPRPRRTARRAVCSPIRARPSRRWRAVLNGAKLALVGEAPWLAEAGYPVSSRARSGAASPSRRAQRCRGRSRLPPEDAGRRRRLRARRHRGRDHRAARPRPWPTANLSPQSLAAIATHRHQGRRAGAQRRRRRTRRAAPPVLRRRTRREEATGCVTPPRSSRAETGTPGVAEAAALKAGAADRPKAQLRPRHLRHRPRRRARSTSQRFGRARGAAAPRRHRSGRSGTAHRRPASRRSRPPSDWVGYGLYLDLIADLAPRPDRASLRPRRRGGAGPPCPRAGRRGQDGGAGLARATRRSTPWPASSTNCSTPKASAPLPDAARRVAVDCHPGISALQAASAAAGALIGHDFCAISLSDLLTPPTTILQRLDRGGARRFRHRALQSALGTAHRTDRDRQATSSSRTARPTRR